MSRSSWRTAHITMAEADWKRIQKKTFTRWCNEHLRHCGMIVEDLAVDLCDGLKLIALLKVLSRNSKAIRRYNKKPKIRAQKLENVQVALDFIASEKVKLVNIGTFFLLCRYVICFNIQYTRNSFKTN